MKLTLSVEGEEREFELKRQGDRFTLQDGDGFFGEVELLHRDGARLELRVMGKRLWLYGVSGNGPHHVWVAGRHWRVRTAPQGGASGEVDPGALSVAIPAVVTEVRVAPGDEVKAGDKLILLESMKMVLSIQAPRDGVVKAVRCERAQSVEPGAVLVELEEGAE